MPYRIPKKRKTPRVIHSERTGTHKRIRLYGAAKSARRREIFERAGGRCEEQILYPLIVGDWLGRSETEWEIKRCPNKATEWSHLRHGANKCDCLECGIASCAECHKKRHNAGGKPVPRKPVMEER